MDEIAAQRAYYERSADDYDSMHTADLNGDHFIALGWLSAIIQMTGARSLLDIGTGTGRALTWLKQRHPDLYVCGIEPVEALRQQARLNGLSADEVLNGDATGLRFADDSFDIVCEFGVLHHIRDDAKAVAEMTRVARRGVFISDSNNFGQGGPLTRFVKQTLHWAGLWPVADFVKTRGKGYHWSPGDGVFYSYSVFDSLPILQTKFAHTYFQSTRGSSGNLYRTLGHICVYATNALRS